MRPPGSTPLLSKTLLRLLDTVDNCIVNRIAYGLEVLCFGCSISCGRRLSTELVVFVDVHRCLIVRSAIVVRDHDMLNDV